MRIQDIVEYKTKAGDDIKFELHQDSESDRNFNSEWIVHKLVPRVNGKEAGYLKISYIPKERFDARYPSMVNYILKQYIPRELVGTHWRNMPDEVKKTLVTYTILGRYVPRTQGWDLAWSDQSKIKDMDSETLDHYLEMVDDPKLNKNNAQEFQKFKKFHVDKPLVDYIRVNEDFQRQRIALAMYQEAAKWLDKQGLLLHASGLQQPAAKAAWEKMKSLGWTAPAPSDPSRTVINPKKTT